MPKITEEHYYDGARERIARLGLEPLIQELRAALKSFRLSVKEKRNSNGGAAVRRLLDERFEQSWTKAKSGEIDWTQCHTVNGTRVCIGVEIQVSARSDLLVIDIIHLRKALVSGQIDVGIIVVPSDKLGVYLTDRAPKMSDAKRHVEAARADDLPLVLIAIEHDGPGPPLAKQPKR